MKLSDFLEDFAVGEISKVNLGDNDEPGLTEYNHKEIIAHINKGIYDLHIRFNLRVEEVFLQQKDSVQFYYLRPEFAESNTSSTEPVKYIKDSTESPFTGDIIKITQVFDESGEELPINDDSKKDSIYTPEYDLIQVQNPSSSNSLSILYKPEPDKLNTSGSYLDQEIYLPRFLQQALEYFVLFKVFSSREFVDNAREEDRFWAKYERELAYIIKHDLHMADNTTNVKLQQNGWV